MDFTPEETGGRAGETAMFWGWITLLTIGLTYMIAIPLIGR